jgi:hypothetical protein
LLSGLFGGDFDSWRFHGDCVADGHDISSVVTSEFKFSMHDVTEAVVFIVRRVVGVTCGSLAALGNRTHFGGNADGVCHGLHGSPHAVAESDVGGSVES